MNRTRLFSLLLLSLLAAALAAAAEPAVKATLTVDGSAIELTHVVAFTGENAFDEKKVDIMLLFTDKPVSPEAVEHNSSLRSLGSEGRFRGVLVSIDDEKQPYSTEVYQKDVMHQGSGNALYLFEPKRFDRTEVAGTIRTEEPKNWMDHEWSFAAEFDTPVRELMKAPAGEALPADGGEPGKAYLAFHAALVSGDMKTLKKLACAERAQQMNDPKFKEMLPMVQELQPKKVTFVSGLVDGSKAVLALTGESPGETSTGTVNMVLESGQWKVATESWRSKSE